MREKLLPVLMTWRGRMLAVLAVAMLVASVILAYKAGQARLLG